MEWMASQEPQVIPSIAIFSAKYIFLNHVSSPCYVVVPVFYVLNIFSWSGLRNNIISHFMSKK